MHSWDPSHRGRGLQPWDPSHMGGGLATLDPGSHIYIYIYIYICVYVYIYIYICICLWACVRRYMGEAPQTTGWQAWLACGSVAGLVGAMTHFCEMKARGEESMEKTSDLGLYRTVCAGNPYFHQDGVLHLLGRSQTTKSANLLDISNGTINAPTFANPAWPCKAIRKPPGVYCSLISAVACAVAYNRFPHPGP